MITVLAVGLTAGCGSEAPTSSVPVAQALFSSNLVLSAGTTVDSAHLKLHLRNAPTPLVTLHQVTTPWDESMVTWNSFAGAYDATDVASFEGSDTGWIAINVSQAVAAWLTGALPNNGLLMKYAAVDTLLKSTCVDSRELGETGPMLLLYCSMVDTTGGDSASIDTAKMEMLMAGADAPISQEMPDSNFGTEKVLCMEKPHVESPEVQSLVWFDVEIETDPGCTYGKGFWKNHAGFGPQDDEVTDLLPQSLGDGGAKALDVTDADIAVKVLQQHWYGHPSNGITKLYAHLLTAKLNIENGAASDDVSMAIADADDFLADHDWKDWDSLDKASQKMVLKWKGKLESYNEGEIGPGHCGDDHDDGDDDDDGDESTREGVRTTNVAAAASN